MADSRRVRLFTATGTRGSLLGRALSAARPEDRTRHAQVILHHLVQAYDRQLCRSFYILGIQASQWISDACAACDNAGLQDHELYRRILGIEAPWFVDSVELKLETGEIHVYLDITK